MHTSDSASFDPRITMQSWQRVDTPLPVVKAVGGLSKNRKEIWLGEISRSADFLDSVLTDTENPYLSSCASLLNSGSSALKDLAFLLTVLIR